MRSTPEAVTDADATFERMSAFRRQFGELPHKSTSPAYYRWKRDENPSGRGALKLVERDGVVAGSASVTFKRVAVNGREVRAVEIGDTYTGTNFRRQGIFAEAVQFCTTYAMESGAAFIYGTPNDASLPGYEKKMNYRQVPGTRVAIMTKYLSAEAVGRRIVARLRLPFGGSIAGRFYLAGMRLKAAMRTPRSPASPVRSGALPVSDDGLWGDRRGYAFFNVRDRQYLDWRFGRNPDSYELLFAGDPKHPDGFVALKIFERDGERVGALCDFVARSDDRNTFLTLLASADRFLRSARVAYAEVWSATSSSYFAWLQDAGFTSRTTLPLIVYAGSSEAAALLDAPAKWHFTRADSDNI